MVARESPGHDEGAESESSTPVVEDEAELESAVVEAWAHEPDPLDPVEGTTEDYTGR